MVNLEDWAAKWGVPALALADLQTMVTRTAVDETDRRNETAVGNAVRAEGARHGVTLWRNNVGVLKDETGRPVRYGLANDSPALNKTLKSSDQIGWKSFVIESRDVGRIIAQFACREIKRPDWRYTGTDREVAQARWLELVTLAGGDACFANGAGTFGQ